MKLFSICAVMINFREAVSLGLREKEQAVILGGGDAGNLASAEIWPDYQNSKCTVNKLPDSQPHYAHNAVSMGTLVYVCGGDVSAILQAVSCHVADVALDGSWHPIRGLNVGRSLFSLIAMEDKIVAIGGYAGTYLDSIEVYDGEEWTLLPFTLKTPRYAHCSVRINTEEILVMGGGSLDTTEIINLRTGSSTFSTSMTMLRRYFGCTFNAAENRVYVSGGSGTSGLAEYLDLDTKEWSRIGNLNHGRDTHKMEFIDGKLTVFGGSDKNYEYMSSVEEYDTMSNTWVEVQPMQVHRYSMAVVPVYC